MKKITEYITVSITGDHKELDRLVNSYIERGYQPFGGVSTTVDDNHVYFTQALVKYEE